MARWQVACSAGMALALSGVWMAGAAPAAAQATMEQLMRELEAMKRRLEKVEQQTREQQETIRKQNETIEKLRGQAASPPAAPRAAAATAAPPPPPPPPAQAEQPWSPAQPIPLLSGARAYMNISFDALIDAGWSTTADVPSIEQGDHDPLQRGFTLPNEEIFLDGAVDPYFKGVADLVFKLDENNETDVELEEVYLTTTALPWNLQVKAGQYFSDFGRLNQQHPHAWDFVDQPIVIGRMFGPEGLRNPGARVSWLLPTPFYSELFLSMQDSQGTTAFSFRDDQDEMFGRPPVDNAVHSLGDMLYVPRYAASFDLTDSQTLVAGLSAAFGPNDSGSATRTQIYGGDLYWKWKPAWQSGGFPFVAWQTEALGRRFEAGAVPASMGVPALPHETLYSWGLYSQLVYGFRQRWAAGLRGGWATGEHGAFAGNDATGDRLRVSPALTFYPTEFSKLRLQYNYDHGQVHGDDSSVWLQVEFLLGSHAAHKF